MKQLAIQIALSVLFLIAVGSTMIGDGSPHPPFCPPGLQCN